MASNSNEPLISISENSKEEDYENGNSISIEKEENGKEEEHSDEETTIESKSNHQVEEIEEEDNTTEKSPLMENVSQNDDFLSHIANFKSPKKKDRSEMTMKEKIAAEGQLTKLYFGQTWKQIKKGKVNFCLGCSAVFIVVVVVGVLLSVLSNAPVFFLRLAELQSGEIDVRFQMEREQSSVNYTLVKELLSNLTLDGENLYQYTSPRMSGTVGLFSPDACFDLVNITGNIDFENNPDVDNIFCTGGRRGWLWAINSEREKEIGIGRNWDKPKLGKGEVYVDSEIASALRLGKNSYAVLNIPPSFFRAIWPRLLPYPDSARQFIFLTVLIKDTFRSGGGKMANDFKRGIFIEFDTLTEFLSEQISGVTDEIREDVRNIDLNGQVLMNIPPSKRFKFYINSNFDAIQKKITKAISLLSYEVGFTGITTNLPVLSGLYRYRNMSLFLGVIINVIIFILLFICCVLIFSLLITNVETRTFEIGMMKMFGMKQYQVISLLLVQSISYTLFSYPLGLLAAQGILAWVFSALSTLINVKVDPALSGSAVGLSALLGFSVPIISAVLPIKNAMGVHLYEALNVRRATAAVKISLERSEDQRFNPAIMVTGFGTTLFGVSIYYIMPLSLLSSNLQLLLNLFTFLLISMLVGMTLLSINLQYVLEKFLVYFLFFWERASVRSMILKNLVAHRERNLKTTLLYAVSLGFIVFISVSYSIQAVSILYEDQQSAGALMRVSAEIGEFRLARVRAYEVLAEESPVIEGYTWISQPLQAFPNVSDVQATNLGHVFSANTRVYAVSPNYFDVALDKFLRVDHFDDKKYNGLSLSEAVYTPRGSHSVIAGSLYQSTVGMKEDKHFLLDISYSSTDLDASVAPLAPRRVSLTPMAFLNGAPGFLFSPFPQNSNQDAIVSMTTLLKISQRNISIGQLPMLHFLIKFKSNATDSDKDTVKRGLEGIAAMEDYAEIFDARDNANTLDTANKILSYFFNFTTAIAMIVCFFSLKSSMFNSIYSQSKEISILRAMGVSKFWLYRVYIYEAFILVLSSSILGMLIGTFVGYTMVIQRVLFTQLPLPFVFPTNILIVVAVSSLLLGFVASFGPIRYLLRMSTVELMRFYY